MQPEGWTLLAIFVATIVAIISKPMPMGVVAFVGLTVAAVMEVFTLNEALSGFSNPVIWSRMDQPVDRRSQPGGWPGLSL